MYNGAHFHHNNFDYQFGDNMKNEEIFSLSLDIGEAIIKCGGEVYRAKDTIKRINNAYGNECIVFALPSLVIAQSNGNIQVRKIERENTDLAEIDRLNELSRRLCYEENEEINITTKKIYSKPTEALCVCIATAVFCLFFGGTVTDAVFSSLIGMIITYSPYKRIPLESFSANLLDSFIAGICAHIPMAAGIDSSPDKIIIGAIMLLVPGLTVVNAMRDLMSGDPAAGMLELFNSIISALGIAFGAAGAIFIFNGI